MTIRALVLSCVDKLARPWLCLRVRRNVRQSPLIPPTQSVCRFVAVDEVPGYAGLEVPRSLQQLLGALRARRSPVGIRLQPAVFIHQRCKAPDAVRSA